MHVQTKYLRLFREVGLGDDIEGWRVCWLGGWDKYRVVFVVMVKRVIGEISGSDFMPANGRGLPGCVAVRQARGKKAL
jgi:hypothetical protein